MAQYSSAIQILLTRIDDLQAQIEVLRPIKPELVSRIFQKYRLDWNYNSNSIEGNSLNYGETVAFIMEGLTAKGKPLKDHLDIKGHNDAIDFLTDMQRHGSELTERDIRSLHQMILVEPYQSKAQTADGQETTKTIQLGVYKSSPNHVVTRTGQVHYYATPEETPAKMHELMEWYREHRDSLHPLVLSTLFHHRFVAIHPFDDGNGRMSRLLSNLILMQAGLPPVVVRQDQKSEYYGVLSQADAGITDPLIEYFANLLLYSLDIYLKGAHGEDISEATDLDKEIALFIASFDEEELKKIPLSQEVLENSGTMLFDEFFSALEKPTLEIGKLFFDSKMRAVVKIIENDTVKNEVGFVPVNADVFLTKWSHEKGLKDLILDKYKEGINDGGIIRVFLIISYSGFKASFRISPIEGVFIFSFTKSYYSISSIEMGRSEIRKSYPKSLLKVEAQSLVKDFFQELMLVIKSSVSNDIN